MGHEEQKARIRSLTERIEASTGVQVLAMAAGKCDAYPELPWRAFALGAALAGLAMVLPGPGWESHGTALLTATAVLGAGAALALLSVFAEPVARAFLGAVRAEAEVRQYAQTQFLERGLTRTRSRCSVLVLVALFERRSALVADVGVSERLPVDELNALAAAMDRALGRGRGLEALAEGLAALEAALAAHGFRAQGGGPDEIADEFLETPGP